MPLHSLQRWLGSVSPWSSSHIGRPRGFGGRFDGQALADARLDFADVLIDLRSAPAISALDRIAVARSLQELWNVREEIYALVAHRHDQSEASRRVGSLDRHFAARPRRTRFAALAEG